MDINTITTLISSVGFPIFCCIAIFYYMQKESEKHAEEVKNLTDVLQANTLAITQLKDALDKN